MQANINSIQIHFSKEGLFWLNICLGYIMFGIALELKRSDFLHLLRFPKSALIGILSQYIIFPLITFLLIKVLHPDPTFALGMILISACPSGSISNFITHLAKGNTALSVSLTALSTILSPVITPLIFTIFGKMDPGTSQLLKEIHVSFADVFQALFFILLLPLLAGLLVNSIFPAFTERSKKFFKISSLLIFFSFILGAMAGNLDVFKNHIYLVAMFVFIQDTLGFASGYLLGTIARLSEKDRRSISIGTGIHNSGLGLILVFTFFNGLGGMALIVAWWGIWHLISGMSIAAYWNFKKIAPAPGVL